jgi:hypothetical protein
MGRTNPFKGGVVKRIWILGALSLVIAAAGIFVGCGDKTTSSNLQPLDTTSAAVVNNNVSQPVIDMSGEDAENVLDLVNTIPAPPGAPMASPAGGNVFDTIQHTYENGWHVFYFSYNRTDTAYHGDTVVVKSGTVHGWDSIRIWLAGQPVQYRGASDSLEARGHGNLHAWDSRANEILGVRHRVLRVEGNAWADPITQLVFNGSSTDTVHATHHPRLDATCEADNYYAGSINDVVLDSAAIYGDGCPPSGSMSFTANVSLLCTGSGSLDSLNVDGSWSIHVTFNGATQTISLSNGLASAVHVDSCGSTGAPAVAPFRFDR